MPAELKKKKRKKSNKGSPFEREVSKELSLWWTQDEKEPNDAVFWRTSQSGGRATERAKKGKKTPYSYGDITFIDPIGKPFIDYFLLELKRGYTSTIDVLDFLDRSKGEPILLTWWLKAQKEKELAKRKGVLIIFRRDRHEKCVMIHSKLFSNFGDWFGDFPDKGLFLKLDNHMNFVILRYESFLYWVHPSFFLKKK